MATRFAQQFRRAGSVSLMAQFGDDVIYYAGGVGDGRAIKGMIERDVSVISEAGDVVGLAFVIRVLDNDTTGISSTEVDTGTDLIGVSLRVGEEMQQRQVVRVISTENGIVRLQVQ